MTLGQRVRALRVAKGMSLRELGRAMDVSLPFLGDLERDRRTPSPARIVQLSDALGVSVTELVSLHPSQELRDLVARCVWDARLIDGSLVPKGYMP